MSSGSLLFIWLDKRTGYIPGGNEKLKEKFRKILSPIRQFDKPTNCYDFIRDSTKDKKVLFITTSTFAEEDFLHQIALLTNVYFIYIYDQDNKQFNTNDKNILEKLGSQSQRLIHFDEILYEQIITDLIQLNKNQAEIFIKNKQFNEAKQLIEYSLNLIETCDEINQDLQIIQQDLYEKLKDIK